MGTVLTGALDQGFRTRNNFLTWLIVECDHTKTIGPKYSNSMKTILSGLPGVEWEAAGTK